MTRRPGQKFVNPDMVRVMFARALSDWGHEEGLTLSLSRPDVVQAWRREQDALLALHAAAPDMLAALKQLHEDGCLRLASGRATQDESDWLRASFDTIASAVARAEGRKGV